MTSNGGRTAVLRIGAAAAGVGALMFLGQATACADGTDGASSTGPKATGSSARGAHSATGSKAPAAAGAQAAAAKAQRPAVGSLTAPPSAVAARAVTARAIPTPGALVQQLFTAINSLLFNAAPSVDPLTTRRSQAGVITGTLRASDAESDPIRYAVVKGPEFGSVTVDSGGTYTYTPTAGRQDDGGVDEFVVAVVDTTHFLSIPRHFTFESVTVVRGNTGPQVVSAPTVLARDEDTGLVRGTVSVIDADGDPITYSYGGDLDPALGTVTVDSVTGAWTATPTVAAIAKAGSTASPEDDYLRFTINATQAAAVAVTTSMTATAPAVPEYVIQQARVRSAPVRIVFHNMNAPTAVIAPTALNSYSANITGRPTAVAVNPATGEVYVATRAQSSRQPGTLTVFGADGSTVIASIPTGALPTDVAVSKDGAHVYVGNTGGHSITVMDTATNTVSATIQGVYNSLNDGGGLAVSSDGSRLYSAGEGGKVMVIDTATNKVLTSYQIGSAREGVYGVALSSDGAKLYVSSGSSLKVANVADGAVTSTIALQYTYTNDAYRVEAYAGIDPVVPSRTTTALVRATRIVVSPDGKTLYVSSSAGPSNDGNGALFVVDAQTAQLKTVVTQPVGNVRDVNFPKYLAISSDGSTLYFTDALYLNAMNTSTYAIAGYRTSTQVNGSPLSLNSDGTGVFVGNFTQTRGGYLLTISLTG